jgi:hypothetical protein
MIEGNEEMDGKELERSEQRSIICHFDTIQIAYQTNGREEACQNAQHVGINNQASQPR